MAEIIGIHFGDGCMDIKNHSYRITYAINFSEKYYANYIFSLFETVFGIKLKSYIRLNRNCIELYYYSKLLCIYFNEFLEIPYSPKNNLLIPSFLKEDISLLIPFIKGVFDTDGCITTKKGKYCYPMIKLTTKHRDFADQLSESLKILGITNCISKKKDNCGRMGFDVVINGKMCSNFMNKIGSNNLKNIQKWGCWDLNPDFTC